MRRRLTLAVTAALAAASVSLIGGSQPVGAATLTFTSPGVQPDFVVPAGVCAYTAVALGASGGAGRAAETEGIGGLGARVDSTITVVAGDAVTVAVGGQGQSGDAGSAGGIPDGGPGGTSDDAAGGGGGSSSVKVNAAPVVVAGGGGGGGGGGQSNG